MKYLAIILILFAVPVFAADYDKNFPPLGAEICYTIDISPLKLKHVPPKPKKTSNFNMRSSDRLIETAVMILIPNFPWPFD